jgi:hypothetical protein
MSLGAWSTRELFAKEFALWLINDALDAFFRVSDLIKLSHNIFLRVSTTVATMSSINIDMPFLNDLDELEFLEEFAGRPFVSEEEFVDAFLSL